MKIAGIIAEYNPFHLGHAYHIAKTREAGATHVVAVMSGSAVQRGDVAIFDSHFRAEAAVNGGADLVLELPAQFSLCPARDFAEHAVGILSKLGCVDVLSFGAETEDVGELCEALDKITASEMKIKELMSAGKTYPAAAAEICGEKTAALLSGQNNTLALEYLRALKKTGIAPLAIKRTVPHDSEEERGGFASASHIRELLKRGESAEKFLGYRAEKVAPAFIENGEKALLYRLSAMSKEDFAKVPYCKELAPRLYRASRRATSLFGLYEEAKTRNFTHSRVRRAVLSAALGITEDDLTEPEFARVLALNERGAEILKLCKSRSQIPVGSSLAELAKLSPKARRQAELTELSSRLQSLCCAAPGRLSEYETSARVGRG